MKFFDLEFSGLAGGRAYVYFVHNSEGKCIEGNWTHTPGAPGQGCTHDDQVWLKPQGSSQRPCKKENATFH